MIPGARRSRRPRSRALILAALGLLSAFFPAPPSLGAGSGEVPEELEESAARKYAVTGTTDLEKDLAEIGGELRWDPYFGSGVVSRGGREAAFMAAGEGAAGETGPVLLDGGEVVTLPLPYREEGALRFPPGFIDGLGSAFDRLERDALDRMRIAAIIIDPGHGGKDAGAIGEHTLEGKTFTSVEKDVVLQVSLLLRDRLLAAFPDKKVLLTRDSDTYPSLEDRVALANAVPLTDTEAVIYISVHANASFASNARGYEVWYLSPGFRRELIDPASYGGAQEVVPILNSMMEEEFTTESILMAQSILTRFDELLGGDMPSRGLKEEEWFVVRNARMPSVLVELGFVTNPTDALYMADPAYLNKFAEALYKGIVDFVALFEQSGGFTAQL